MKNLTHLVGYLIAIGLTFFLTKSYFCTPETGEDPIVTTERPEAPIDCVVAQCSDNCRTPKAIISLKEVEALYQGYGGVAARCSSQNKMDKQTMADLRKLLATRGIWFDYQEFKSYLSYIDKNAKEANVSISGIRFFPGRSTEDNDKYGQLTLFYNPTIKTKNKAGLEDNYAFALDRNGNEVRPVLFEEFISNNQQQQSEVNEGAFFTTASAAYNLQSLTGNRGQMSPPPND